ncbi:response regulator transcription factor [Sinomonas atrocyanea]|uniref:response regulator transcription factor n=1 Tax=Sinomonas atrocyanea TaxID=37927 RepID=UPI0027D8E2BC|nr:response regulator transcription factor [Sinomonas atrocyanea]
MNGLGIALVVEDDEDIRGLLEDVLGHAGFDVRTASTGREGAELARTEHPTVVTLDVGLPDIDGFEVLRRIRGASDAYVVMVSARDEEPDALFALQSGADDYLTKPFRPRELRARIGAMLRRPRAGHVAGTAGALATAGGDPRPPQAHAHGWMPRPEQAPRPSEQGRPYPAPTPPQPGDRVLRNGRLALDPHTRMASVAGVELELTRSEFDLLHALLRAGGRVLTRAELVRVARGDRFRDDAYVSEADERAVEVHIGNLRRKLGDDPRAPRWLMTIRGVGYRLRPAAG